MRINLTPKKGSRRFAGAAVAVSALAMMLGLIPAASAHTVARAGPAAVAAPRSSTCRWLPTPAQLWVTDPVNSPVGLIAGVYGSPGSRGVAYRVNGQFTHTTTMSFTVLQQSERHSRGKLRHQRQSDHPGPGVGEPLRPGQPGGSYTPELHRVFLAGQHPGAGRTEERRPVSDEAGVPGHGPCPVGRRDAPVPPAARVHPASRACGRRRSPRCRQRPWRRCDAPSVPQPHTRFSSSTFAAIEGTGAASRLRRSPSTGNKIDFMSSAGRHLPRA